MTVRFENVPRSVRRSSRVALSAGLEALAAGLRGPPRPPIPFDRLLEPGLEPGACLEAEVLLGPLRVEEAPRLPIRFTRIPEERSLESRKVRNELSKILDRNLDTGPEVHWLITVIPLSREHDTFGRICHVEKLTGGFPRTPHGERGLSSDNG